MDRKTRKLKNNKNNNKKKEEEVEENSSSLCNSSIYIYKISIFLLLYMLLTDHYFIV